ncbi:MAG: beta-lactamase family protein [Steroidobacteraceae bacterium]|nr:beta-lactamase family protein [Steroidobacteraceae bacterium]
MRENSSAPFFIALLCSSAFCGEPPERDKSLAALAPVFEKFIAENHVPGLVYGVVADGKLVFVGGLGVQDLTNKTPVTADTVFRIASMSKQFAALATLKLRDAGKLDLDAPAEKYILELAKQRYPTTDSPKIRMRDLLSHAAGFVTDDPWGDRQLDIPPAAFGSFVAAGVPTSRAPGMAYEYSNYGYALVGRAITNTAHTNYSAYIASSFFRPLGMTATVYDIARIPAARRALGYRWERDAWREEPQLGHGEFGAMGGVATSANDYAKYVVWVLSAWPPRDGAEDSILRRSSVREIARPQNYAAALASSEPDGCPRSVSYGFGVIPFQDCVLGIHFGHSGGLPGFGSNVLFVPDRGLAVFAFANRTYTPASRAVRDAANLLVRSGAFPARPHGLSAGLQSMLDAALRIYASGDVLSERGALAMNLLLDRDAALRNSEIAALKEKTGACAATPPYFADSATGGTFELACERGKVKLTLLLAPTTPASLQRLEFAQ